jgi:hypothetical protein
VRRLPNDHQQSDAKPHDSGEFVWLGSDAPIMGQRYPSVLAGRLEPGFVACVRREVILMSFDSQATRPQYFWKLLPEVSVSKEDKVQAARS